MSLRTFSIIIIYQNMDFLILLMGDICDVYKAVTLLALAENTPSSLIFAVNTTSCFITLADNYLSPQGK